MFNKIKSKGGWLFLLTLFLFGVTFFVASVVTVQAGSKVVINEIFPNPKGSDKGKEFVELYNNRDEVADLDGWVLKKTSKTGLVKEYTFHNKEIKANKYLEIKFSGLNNDGATLELISDKGETLETKEYDKVVEDKSYNRNEEDDEGNWYWAEATGGEKNNPDPVSKKYPKIIINEILPNPITNETKDEFIELYNPNEYDVDLKDWIIRDGSKTGKYIFKKGTVIKAGKYFVIYRKDFKFALNNSGEETVILLDPNDNVEKDEYSDKIKYKNSIEGQSYNRDEDKNSGDWYWAEETAGDKNVENPLIKKCDDLLITEVLPNPAGKEEEKEFIEIYNPGKKDVKLKGWALSDSSTNGKYLFSKEAVIKSKQYLVVYRKDFKFALNNSGGEVVKLIAPNHKIKNEIYYQSAKENISYNFDLLKRNWRWSKFLTPAKPNRFNSLPTFKLSVPDKIYKNVYAEFKISKLKDADGDKIKVTWDFGDGHKSYLKKTKHKYEKTGKYAVKLIVKDDSEEVIKEFTVRVKKYPKYKLKIIGIMPNPNGKDTGKEIIIIKNLEKKRLNLGQYKIATGRNENKLSNHPFYDDFKIKAKKSRALTNNSVCKFSLLNTNGVVQLLYPNGKVADEVKYEKKKILPNEMYKLDEKSGQWYWQGGIGVFNKSTANQKSVEVLGAKNERYLDITLDNEQLLCSTVRKIKIDNWKESNYLVKFFNIF